MMIEENGGPVQYTQEEFFLEQILPQRISSLATRYKRSVRDGTDETRYIRFYSLDKPNTMLFIFSDSYYEAKYEILRQGDNITVKILQQYYTEQLVGWWIFRRLKRVHLSTDLTHTFKNEQFRSHTRFNIIEELYGIENYGKEDRSLNRFLAKTEEVTPTHLTVIK